MDYGADRSGSRGHIVDSCQSMDSSGFLVTDSTDHGRQAGLDTHSSPSQRAMDDVVTAPTSDRRADATTGTRSGVYVKVERSFMINHFTVHRQLARRSGVLLNEAVHVKRIESRSTGRLGLMSIVDQIQDFVVMRMYEIRQWIHNGLKIRIVVQR
jgi:hypothetical protein